MVYLVRAEPEHASKLADNLRHEEVREILCSHGRSPHQVIPQTLEMSAEAWTAFEGDTLLCITGVVPVYQDVLAGGWASPWLLSTRNTFSKDLLRGTKMFVEKWKQEYHMLFNYVDTRYSASLRWAKWAGFEVHDPVPYGPYGLPFNRIEIRN